MLPLPAWRLLVARTARPVGIAATRRLFGLTRGHTGQHATALRPRCRRRPERAARGLEVIST